MKDRLNILIFVQDFLPLTQSFIHSEIEGLARKNNVLVICINESTEQFYKVNNLRRINYAENIISRKIKSFLYRVGIAFLLKKPKLEQELSAIISSFQPDIIHTHFGHQSLPIIENISTKEIPIFISFHGIDASLYIHKSRLYRNKIREVLSRNSVSAIFDSHFLIDNLKKHNIGSERSYVHYLGINTEKFNRSKSTSREPFIFVQVGAFRPKKGHIYTIRAFKRLLERTHNVKLIFAGSGAHESRIKHFVRENNMDSFVEFMGDINQDMVVELLDSTHAFVHPSVTDDAGNTEGLPISIKEAMSMQLPIVSTRHSGIPELIRDGIHGYLCAERDEKCLYDAMLKIMDMPYLKINQEAILLHHNIHNSTDKLLSHYRKTLLES